MRKRAAVALAMSVLLAAGSSVGAETKAGEAAKAHVLALQKEATALTAQHQYDQALAKLKEAVEIAHANKQGVGEAALLTDVGDIHNHAGSADGARDSYTKALAIYRRVRLELGEATLLGKLGELEERMGRLDAARQDFEQALPLFRRLGKPDGEADALAGLAAVYLKEKRLEQALISFQTAIPLYQKTGNGIREALATEGMAATEAELRQTDAARRDLDLARALFRQHNYPKGEANVLLIKANLEHIQGNAAVARALYEESRAIWHRLGDGFSESRALFSLAEHLRQNNPAEAKSLLLEAADILASLNIKDWEQEARRRAAAL